MKNLALIPLKIEQEAFIKALTPYVASRRGNLFWLPHLNTICALGGLGQAPFYKKLKELLLEFQEVEQVFALGSCGTLKKELPVYEIIVGTKIIENKTSSREKTRAVPLPINQHESLLKTFKKTRLHTGSIVSVDSNIFSEELRNKIYQDTQGLCVCWESIGGVTAALESHTLYNEFRVITDLCNSESKKSFYKTVSSGMALIAQLYLHLTKPN